VDSREKGWYFERPGFEPGGFVPETPGFEPGGFVPEPPGSKPGRSKRYH